VLRHEFQPGRLIAGVFVTAVGIAYVGDAAGAWPTKWFAAFPLLMAGLFLAAVAGITARSIRRHRRARGGTDDGANTARTSS
jgi:membrane protein implicated in regulation of membrane protease activity